MIRILLKPCGQGNSADPFQGEWLDPSLAGLQDADELRDWWLQLIDGMGSGAALFQRGAEQVFDPDTNIRNLRETGRSAPKGSAGGVQKAGPDAAGAGF